MRFRAVLLAGVCLGLNPFEIVWGQGPTITFNIDHVKIYPPNLNDNQTLKTNVVVRNPVTFDLGMSYVYKRVPPYSDFTASATFTLTAPSGSLSGQRRTYGGRDYYVLDSPTTFQITSDYTSNSGFPEDTFSVFMAGYVGDGDCQLTPRKTGLTPSGSCTFQYIPISRPEDRGDDSSQPTYLLLEGRITPLFSVVNDLYFSAYFNPQPTDRISIDGSQAAACGAGGAASRDPLPRATPVCYPDSIDGVQVVWDPRRDPRGEEDPLVYKKSAILRVFLDSNGANDVTSGISGQITTPNTTFNLGIPNTQVNKGPVKARADKTAVLQDIDGSLNFLIQPKDQIGKGPSKFHIDVLQNGQVQASKDVTLYFDLPQIYPAGSKPIPTWPERLAIGYFLFCPSPASCPANPPDGTTNFANNIFPLRDHGITFTKILDNQTWTQQISPVSGSYQPSAAWKMTKTMLLLYTLLDLKEFGVDQLIAWAPASLVGTGLEGVSAGDGKTRPTTKEDGGLGHVWWMEAPESFAVADVWGKELAHALAHNLGLADVSAPIGPGAFDVINYAIPTPDTESLMASLVGGWPSKEQYADIYTGYMIDPGPGKRESLQQFVLQIASPSPEPSSRNPRDTSPSGYIVISGDLSQDGSIATFDAGFNVPSATAGSQSDPYGSHCLRFGSDSTNDYCFNPVFLDSGNTAPAGGFAVKAPLPAGTNSISLIRRDGTGGEAVLTTLKAAPDPPSLTILSPHNGDTLMGRQTLQWTATDPGGLPLTYALQYSSDNGASWTPLTFPTTDTQYPIDSASMVGPQVMIRVLASNGLQTTTAVVGPLKLLQSTKVDVSTTTLDFGTVSPATGSVEQSFSITSSGTGPFKPAFQIAGDAGFQVVSPATVIWPGKQSTVTVQVDPGAATSGRATLSISTPDATQTPVNVQLTATISGGGSGTPSVSIVAKPATLDFGSVSVRQKSTPQTVTITNSGSSNAALTLTASAGFTVTPATLTVNGNSGTGTASVTFAPATAGAQQGTLTITASASSVQSVTVNLTGTGTSSGGGSSSLQFLAGSPEAPITSYDFGTVAVNQTKDVVIKLLNNGSAGGNFNLSIDNPRFIVSTGTLGAGSNGGYNTFGIRFAPTDASAQTGTLTVTGFGQTAKLSLKGNSGGGGGGSCSGSPISTTLTVTGSGTSSSGNISASGPLTLSGVGTGTFSSNFSLASAAASGSVPVTFTVSSGSPTGTLTGTLTGSAALLAQVFAGNPSSSGAVTITITGGTGSFAGATGTFNATASGNGVGTTGSGAGNFKLSGAGTINLPSSSCGSGTPTISVTVPVADFGTVNTGATKDLTVTIASTGTSTLSVTPTMAPNPPFSILGSPAALSINAGTNQTLTIRFSPTAAGVQTGTLNLVTDDQAHKNLTFQFTGTGVTPAGACVAPPANIVSWWAGDGNANDLKGGNNGTLQSGGSYASGQVAQAFSFDGANGYVRVGDPANLRLTSALTIEGWIYPRALASGNGNMSAIVTKWAQNFSIVSDADSWGFWLRNNNGSGSLFSGIHVNSGGEPNIQGGSVPINAWSHVAVTFDSATGRHFIYLNGQVVASGTPNLPLLATSRNILIGREDSSSPRPFNGLIDELSVYSRALGAAEIQSIYQAGSAGKCK